MLPKIIPLTNEGSSPLMPRAARLKDKQSIYHIMVRSIKEVNLFENDEDKLKYFSIIKKYMEKFKFKVYAYCLMDNHGHLMIDANGADISRIMHSINFSYAQYFNRAHKRHGHLFQERFKSKIVSDDSYLIALSAYIHKNPKDIFQYAQNVEKYPFSSLREYIDNTNQYQILDKDFLWELMNLSKEDNFKRYLSLMEDEETTSIQVKDMLDIEFERSENEYRSHRTILPRNHTPEGVVDFIAKYTGANKGDVHIKNNKKYTKIRAVSCFLMSCFCNIHQKHLCVMLGNITQSRVSKLCSMGIEIAYRDKEYEGIVEKFLKGA